MNVNELKKMADFEVHFRKQFEELADIISLANAMILKGNHCLVEYQPESHLFRVKIYICRQKSSFSSLIFSGIIKESKDELKPSLSSLNMVAAYKGYLQFSIIESTDPTSSPILHVDVYEPKDAIKTKLLKESLSTI